MSATLRRARPRHKAHNDAVLDAALCEATIAREDRARPARRGHGALPFEPELLVAAVRKLTATPAA